jgi:hypothetical protein
MERIGDHGPVCQLQLAGGDAGAEVGVRGEQTDPQARLLSANGSDGRWIYGVGQAMLR